MTSRAVVAAFAAVLALAAIPAITANPSLAAATTFSVPEEYPTIQAAIDAAAPGDVIDIASGTYVGSVTVDVAVTLRGRTYDVAYPRRNGTILKADAGESVVTIGSGLSPPPVLLGLVFRGGHDGVTVRSPVKIKHCAFVWNRDGLDLEQGGGGLIAHNVFHDQLDDGVDIDHPIHNVRVVRNRIVDSRDDGIEVRLHDDLISKTVWISLAANDIVRSGEDGIQLIDYPEVTERSIVIRRNLIRGSVMAGLGLMDGGETVEDYRAAQVDERAVVVHNTFVNNDLGISGGARLYAVNNIFVGHRVALNGLAGDSIASYTLFWNNAKNVRSSIVDRPTNLTADPLLDPSYHLLSESAAIDAGTDQYTWNGEVVLDQPPSTYRGAAPDIGWNEAA